MRRNWCIITCCLPVKNYNNQPFKKILFFQDRRSQERSRQASARRVHFVRQGGGRPQDVSDRRKHLPFRGFDPRVRRRHRRSGDRGAVQAFWQAGRWGHQGSEDSRWGCQAPPELRNQPEASQSWDAVQVRSIWNCNVTNLFWSYWD